MPGTEPPETKEFDFALGGLVLEGKVEVKVGVPSRWETSVQILG